MPGPLVKVVITSYNRGQWLREATESVLAQTYRDFHIIIVDDASPDPEPGRVIRDLSETYPDRITPVVKAVNRGVADTIRVGIQAGPEAPYVAFLNEDDIWYPDKLRRQVALFDGHPEVGLIFADADLFEPDGTRIDLRYSEMYGTYSGNPVPLREVLLSQRTCASTHIATRAVAAHYVESMPDTTMAWDYVMLMVAATYASVVGIDEPLALYRMGGMHSDRNLTVRAGMSVRKSTFERNPRMVELIGGPAKVRQLLALRSVDAAVDRLEARDWRAYLEHAMAVLRHRSPKAAVWLCVHTIGRLRTPTHRRP